LQVARVVESTVPLLQNLCRQDLEKMDKKKVKTGVEARKKYAESYGSG
jgi:hypothetical protein